MLDFDKKQKMSRLFFKDGFTITKKFAIISKRKENMQAVIKKFDELTLKELYEIMQITKEIKKLVAQGAHDLEIEDAAVAAGMKSLKTACLNHILEGNTTSDEFFRVLGYAED